MSDVVSKIVNSWWMYAIAIFVTIFILVGTSYFIYRAWKRGKELNMETETLKKVVVSSLTFSIAPSIGIFIGVITLSGVIGIPLPWIRLSIIGALHYELMAASAAASSQGGLVASAMDAQLYVTIAWVMTIGIIWGCLICLFFFKKYQKKVSEATRKKENRWMSKILFTAVFIGIVSAFSGQAFSWLIPFMKKTFDEATGTRIDALTKTTYVPIVVLMVSFLSMMLFDYLIKQKKQKWLENFSLAFSMLLGMLAAFALGLGGIY
ncbi:MAG: DUF5058 family protein [Bacilli bacterium]|jgi:hypothetical protein|nr:DUF5058 family protein [Bacilli bacterium]MDD4057159.1 DUF5058 family protein [Bacilli bacterium]